MSRRYWTMPERALFRHLYPTTTMSDLMREFGRSRSAIKNLAVKLRLRKEPWAMVRFPKGNVPWNAGKPYQAGGRSVLTRFRKGGPRPRDRAVGSERVERDGIYVKVAGQRRWVRKERMQWEREHGPIPSGMVLRTNPLRLVSRAENVRLNWKPRGPKRKEIASWITPLGAIAEAA